MNSRRSHLFLVLGVVAALDRRRAARGPRLAGPQEADARPRPAGRPRGRAQGAAAAGPQADAGRPRPLGHDHARSASTSSASPSPRSASRAPTRSSIELAGVHDPEKAAAIIGKTAQLELYDLETSATGPSPANAQGNVTAHDEPLRPARGPAGEGEAGRRRPPTTSSTRRSACAPARRAPEQLRRARTALLDEQGRPHEHAQEAVTFKGELPKGFKVFAVPEDTVVITCGAADGRLPASAGPDAARRRPTTTSSSTTSRTPTRASGSRR